MKIFHKFHFLIIFEFICILGKYIGVVFRCLFPGFEFGAFLLFNAKVNATPAVILYRSRSKQKCSHIWTGDDLSSPSILDGVEKRWRLLGFEFKAFFLFNAKVNATPPDIRYRYKSQMRTKMLSHMGRRCTVFVFYSGQSRKALPSPGFEFKASLLFNAKVNATHPL